MNSLKLNTTYEAITKQRLLFQSSVQAGGGGSAVGSPINGRGRLKGRHHEPSAASHQPSQRRLSAANDCLQVSLRHGIEQVVLCKRKKCLLFPARFWITTGYLYSC